ncbi:MAG: hypothetical protein ACRCX2_10185 [Paraclostridium sp.]
MSDFTVIGFQKGYKSLNLKMLNNEPNAFALGLLAVYSSEVKNGFYVAKQLKTNSRGTNFNFKKFETQEQVEQYREKINEILSTIDKEDCIKEVLKLSKED